jgi:hypothetical protein
MAEESAPRAEPKPQESAANVKERQLLAMSEIGIWLDTYDDIFSDFDPRPYSERALSEDFLEEAKKASRDKASTGNIELKFLIPESKRNGKDEAMIKKRLRSHFSRHSEMLRKSRRDLILKQGLPFVLSGIFLMFAASLVLFYETEKSILSSFLVVLIEPGGWFLFWEGLNQAIFESRKIRPDLEFYDKMSRCEIEFYTY